ncbi:MerR family transcriptional regulator [Fodinicola acaciae]|uniref:MerR family transcriptional regulator n=1 Tax=Fodinicola acaciae TaxID=2681555 RepID=UPI0013D2FE94|nr:MerR family transcriptional regulator [Fodinicola acaciae]
MTAESARSTSRPDRFDDLARLDDQDYPTYTTGQGATLLDVQVAFLRSLDAAGVVRPARSAGGHRRYSRRQLARVSRLRDLFDEGHSMAAAARIADLEDQLADAHHEIAALHERLARTNQPE